MAAGEGTVSKIERITDDGVEIVEVTVNDDGGDDSAADHFASPGEDSPPLPGDMVAVIDGPGIGTRNAVGYADPSNAGIAEPGEKRIYARDSGGTLIAEVWLQGDGTITIKNASGEIELAPSGDVAISGNLSVAGDIESGGNVSADLEVSAANLVPGVSVGLSTHVHTSAAPGSPTSTPTPGS